MDLHEGHGAKEWTALYAVGALSPEETAVFEHHLRDGCAICESELRANEGVTSLLASELSAEPPASVRARLLARVQQEESTATNTVSMTSGVLFQQAGLLISRSSDISWEPAGIPGIVSKALYIDPTRKYATSLVRMAPGTVYPPHRHNDIEEVYLLEGDLLVEGTRMRPGDYCRSEAGSIHGAAKTEFGVLLLVFSSQKDELLAEH